MNEKSKGGTNAGRKVEGNTCSLMRNECLLKEGKTGE